MYGCLCTYIYVCVPNLKAIHPILELPINIHIGLIVIDNFHTKSYYFTSTQKHHVCRDF